MGNIRLIWHKYMLKYNIRSHNDCLDEKLKKKLWNNVEYHEKEIHRIANLRQHSNISHNLGDN